MTKTRWRIPDAYWIGGITGLVGLALSFLGRGIIPGRVLGDPLPLVLSVAQLIRGPLYWNWQAPLIHILFLAILAGLAVSGVYLVRREKGGEWMLAVEVARVTAVINVGVVALMEIDAIVVGFYYIIGGLVSVWITGTVARWMAHQMKR